MHTLQVDRTGQDLRLEAVTAVRAGVGLLATLDALESASCYYYLSRSMDYLAYVGSLLRSADGSSPVPVMLITSRESAFHELAPQYERSRGLGQDRPLLVDTGFHGNILRILLRRWPDAQGRLLESHSSGYASCRVALKLAGLQTDHPSERTHWVVRLIEEAPHEFGSAKGYVASVEDITPVRAPEFDAAAAEFRELVREEFMAAGAGQQLYADLYPCLRLLADWLRHSDGPSVIEFRPDSFGSDVSSSMPVPCTLLVMALRDLCDDISWRGRGAATSVRVRTDSPEEWRREAARISEETGVAVAVSSHFREPEPVGVVDARVRSHPQKAAEMIVAQLDRSCWRLSYQDLGDCVATLRSMGLLSAAIGDLMDTVRLRPADWDLSRLHPLLGLACG
jgi:hypothetical protein